MDERIALHTGSALRSCREIFASGFHEEGGWKSEAAFVLGIVYLNDALQALNQANHRVAFTEYVCLEGKDITDLVARVRNAACHVRSGTNSMAGVVFARYSKVVGHTSLVVGSETVSLPYTDDVAFLYGSTYILLERHLVRAVTEAIQEFKAIAYEIGFPVDWVFSEL